MDSEHKTRIAMVGCGFYAQNHLHAWSELRDKGAELVAVCDLDAAKAAAAGETFGARSFTDVDQMLDTVPVDLVDIATRIIRTKNWQPRRRTGKSRPSFKSPLRRIGRTALRSWKRPNGRVPGWRSTRTSGSHPPCGA